MGNQGKGQRSKFDVEGGFLLYFTLFTFIMATHSSILAWRIPGMGKPGGLPSMGSHRVGHD